MTWLIWYSILRSCSLLRIHNKLHFSLPRGAGWRVWYSTYTWNASVLWFMPVSKFSTTEKEWKLQLEMWNHLHWFALCAPNLPVLAHFLRDFCPLNYIHCMPLILGGEMWAKWIQCLFNLLWLHLTCQSMMKWIKVHSIFSLHLSHYEACAMSKYQYY